MSTSDDYLKQLQASVDQDLTPESKESIKDTSEDSILFTGEESEKDNTLMSEDDLTEGDIERLLHNMEEEKEIFMPESDTSSENVTNEEQDDILKDMIGDTQSFEDYLEHATDQNDIEKQLNEAASVTQPVTDTNEAKDSFEEILGHDSEISEINDLLQKTQNNEPLEDEILALLDNYGQEENSQQNEGMQGMFDNTILPDTGSAYKAFDSTAENYANMDSEIDLPEAKEKKKRVKKRRNKKAKKGKEEKAEITDTEVMISTANSLNPNTGVEIDPSLLNELEEKPGKPEKAKSSKKNKKGKKNNPEQLSENEAIESELDIEKAAKKKKKIKKIKTKKDKEKPQIPEKPYKAISGKGIAAVFIVCLSLALAVICCCILVPANLANKQAIQAFYQEDYDQVVDLLYGKKLTDATQILYDESRIIVKSRYGLELYKKRLSLNMDAEALDALFCGYQTCEELLPEAKVYHIDDKITEIKMEYSQCMAENYQIDEEAITAILDLDALYYTLLIEDIVQKGGYQGDLYPNKQIIPLQSHINQEIQTVNTGNPSEQALDQDTSLTNGEINSSQLPADEEKQLSSTDLKTADGADLESTQSQIDSDENVPSSTQEERELYRGEVQDGKITVVEDISHND